MVNDSLTSSQQVQASEFLHLFSLVEFSQMLHDQVVIIMTPYNVYMSLILYLHVLYIACDV